MLCDNLDFPNPRPGVGTLPVPGRHHQAKRYRKEDTGRILAGGFWIRRFDQFHTVRRERNAIIEAQGNEFREDRRHLDLFVPLIGISHNIGESGYHVRSDEVVGKVISVDRGGKTIRLFEDTTRYTVEDGLIIGAARS